MVIQLMALGQCSEQVPVLQKLMMYLDIHMLVLEIPLVAGIGIAM